MQFHLETQGPKPGAVGEATKSRNEHILPDGLPWTMTERRAEGRGGLRGQRRVSPGTGGTGASEHAEGTVA